MVTITKEHVHFTFSGSHKPVQTVPSGSTVRFETYDCFYNQLLPEGADITKIDSSKANAATGPLCVEEALPGDTLKIEILDITTGPVGVCGTFPGSSWDNGILKEEQFRRLTVKDGMAEFDSAVQIPVRPMIGVIGTAPKEGAVSTMTPMDHGGNMDCTQIKTGSSIYFPVAAEGALLSLGDLHACMGDGEIGGCGVEIAGEVTLKLTVIPDHQKPYPVVVTDKEVMAVASCKTVDEAWAKAVEYLHDYMVTETELTSDEAIMLQSIAADLSICQTVNPNKTVRMSIPLKYLEAYGYRQK